MLKKHLDALNQRELSDLSPEEIEAIETLILDEVLEQQSKQPTIAEPIESRATIEVDESPYTWKPPRLLLAIASFCVALVATVWVVHQSEWKPRYNTIPTPPSYIRKPTLKLTPQQRKARLALLQRMGKEPPRRSEVAVKRRTKQRRRLRRKKRGVRIALKVSKKSKNIDDLIKQRLAERLKKAGVNGGPSKKVYSPKSSNIGKKLVQRLYKELIAKNRGVQYCYNLHLKNYYFGGRLLLSLKIAPSGRVKRVRVSPGKFRGLKFTKCLLREIKYKWRFTPFDGEAVWLESPYSLSAQ